MKSKLFGCLSATVLGAAIALATPAMAQRGGGGFGGMHGGGGFGGMHGGVGGGMHFGGGGFGGGGFRGGMVTGRSVFVPGGNRFAGAPFAGQVNRSNTFPFRHHHFRNFAFFGAPFVAGDAAYGDWCWRQIWTPYGSQWTNVCYDYGN
jgi:hypothetical protein